MGSSVPTYNRGPGGTTLHGQFMDTGLRRLSSEKRGTRGANVNGRPVFWGLSVLPKEAKAAGRRKIRPFLDAGLQRFLKGARAGRYSSVSPHKRGKGGKQVRRPAEAQNLQRPQHRSGGQVVPDEMAANCRGAQALPHRSQEAVNALGLQHLFTRSKAGFPFGGEVFTRRSEGRAGRRIKWPAIDAMDGRRQLKRPASATGTPQSLGGAMAWRSQTEWSLIATGFEWPLKETNAAWVPTPTASE